MSGSNDERTCPACDGVVLEDGLCRVENDSDSLPARCVGLWSDDKLFYLKRYADILAKGMKNKWPNRVYLDLFAGPGRCRIRPTREFVDGSPALALKLPFTHYHFGDLSSSVTAALESRVGATPLEGRSVRIWTDDANKLAPLLRDEVVRLGRETLAFAFIDPPGIEMAFESIRTLTQGLPVDLLINFPLGMNIKRQVRHRLASTKADDPFDAYFGGPEWRDACEENTGGVPFGPRLLELYKSKLRSIGYKYVGDERVVKDRKRNAAYYILVFASKHPKGEEFWTKITKDEPSGQRGLPF